MLGTRGLSLPSRHQVIRNQLVIHSDFSLPADHRLLDELAVRRTDLHDQLGLPMSDQPIHVYLFDSGDSFRRFLQLHYPDLPARRAFFLETDSQLHVYAQWGDRLAEDLRHEATHAYLHSVVRQLPLWLDEGLAEYGEAPRGQHGLSPSHIKLLLARLDRSRWHPNLERLERLEPTRDMSQEDYAESWAWVHFLLETSPDRRVVLQAFLADLRRNAAPSPISARLREQMSQPEEAMVAHLRALSGDAARAQ